MSTFEKEIASFEGNSSITISQYGGEVRGTTVTFNHGENVNFALSHQHYRATDFGTNDGNLYAPCKLKCIYDGKLNLSNAKFYDTIISVFETVSPVWCADNILRDFTLVLMHGGDQAVPEIGKIYNKGDHMYQEGVQGFNGGPHIHMDILSGKCSINGILNQTEFNAFCSPNFDQTGGIGTDATGILPQYSLNFHEVFYGPNITFSSPAEVTWGDYVSFTPAPKHGWDLVNGTYYFYQKGVLIKGWLQDVYGAWYFLDYSTGAMKTGWAADGNNWYYLNPVNGIMKTGWHWDENYKAWYYFNPNNGGAMHTYWLNDGGKLYYLGSDGKMYKDCREKIDGVFYDFDNSGVATKVQ